MKFIFYAALLMHIPIFAMEKASADSSSISIEPTKIENLVAALKDIAGKAETSEKKCNPEIVTDIRAMTLRVIISKDVNALHWAPIAICGNKPLLLHAL